MERQDVSHGEIQSILKQIHLSCDDWTRVKNILDKGELDALIVGNLAEEGFGSSKVTSDVDIWNDRVFETFFDLYDEDGVLSHAR